MKNPMTKPYLKNKNKMKKKIRS